MTTEDGSELINKFIEVITTKVKERKYRWDFLGGFSGNC
jgi:hypothetical protein